MYGCVCYIHSVCRVTPHSAEHTVLDPDLKSCLTWWCVSPHSKCSTVCISCTTCSARYRYAQHTTHTTHGPVCVCPLVPTSVCLSVNLAVCLHVFLSICLPVYLSPCLVFLPTCLSDTLYVSACLSYLSFFLPACPSPYLSVHIPVCLPLCRSLCLPVCLSLYLSVSSAPPVCIYACIPICLATISVSLTAHLCNPSWFLSWFLC